MSADQIRYRRTVQPHPVVRWDWRDKNGGRVHAWVFDSFVGDEETTLCGLPITAVQMAWSDFGPKCEKCKGLARRRGQA